MPTLFTRLKRTGASRHPLFAVWNNIRYKCLNPKHHDYKYYGGRGLKMAKRWQGPMGFHHFCLDMGVRPVGFTVERRKNSRGYFPSNCSWQSRKTQSGNTRSNRKIRFRGRTMILQAWAEELNITRTTLQDRLDKLGWSVKDAFTTPVDTKFNPHRRELRGLDRYNRDECSHQLHRNLEHVLGLANEAA